MFHDTTQITVQQLIDSKQFGFAKNIILESSGLMIDCDDDVDEYEDENKFIEYFDEDELHYLINNHFLSSDVLDSALVHCAREGYLNLVKIFVEKGADINANFGQPLSECSFAEHIEIVEYLLRMGADVHANFDNAIVSSCLNIRTNITKLLLDYGADVQAENNTPIIWAIQNQNFQLVQLLVEYGADVTVYNKYIHETSPEINEYITNII